MVMHVVARTTGGWAGYDMQTHATPCYMANTSVPDCAYWIERERAEEIGVICTVGDGTTTLVNDPEWFLFAGQAYGNVMDFDSEPWDTSCESMGTGTKDTGLDLAQWDLEAGKLYDMSFYPREDGTALDAVYIAGPDSAPPAQGFRLSAGDSTVCPHQDTDDDGSSSKMKSKNGGGGGIKAGAVVGIIFGVMFAIAMGLGFAMWYFKFKIPFSEMSWWPSSSSEGGAEMGVTSTQVPVSTLQSMYKKLEPSEVGII